MENQIENRREGAKLYGVLLSWLGVPVCGEGVYAVVRVRVRVCV